MIPKSVIAQHSNIIFLSKEEISLIPKDYLIACFKRYIKYIFDKLSDDLQKDLDIIMCLPCIHWNLPGSIDHIDGPAWPRKNCNKCVEYFIVK